MLTLKPGRTPIRKKARFVDRQAPEPEWKAIHRAADRNVGRIGTEMRATFERLQRSVALKDLTPALERGDAGMVAVMFDFPQFEKDSIDRLMPLFLQTLQMGARATAPFLERQADIEVRKQVGTLNFEAVNPRAVAEAARQAANLVRQVSLETKMAIRDVIVRAQQAGLTIRQQTREIRRLVGLTQRQAAAVFRQVRALEATGLRGKRLQERADRLFQTAVRRRAQTIARTETIRSANLGQQELWRQAADQGLINTNAMQRVWIVTPDDRLCPFCRPMDGQVVGFEETFISGRVPLQTGGVRHLENTLLPPAHVGCRCAVGLQEA